MTLLSVVYFVTDKTIIMECEHYFKWGYSIEPCVYCTKCDKELFQLGIPESILQTHDVENGKFVLKSKTVLQKPKREGFFSFLVKLVEC